MRPGDPAPIEEIRLAFDGVERDLVDVSGFPNTYNNTRRVDARLSVDADGELYLLTKGDGRIRRLVSNKPDPRNALDFKGTGDFNADGKADVLLRHTDGRWLYYPMNGRRPITAERGAANLPRSLDWRFVGIGDFDANGRDDVLLKHTDGRWAHYAMEGRRRTSGSTVRGLPTDPAWQVQALGDFNGDGADDLLTRHPDGRWHYYPILRRSVVEADAGPSDLPRNLNWRLAGTGDFTGNGKHDVLLRHRNGAWHYYPMNGRTIDAEAAGPRFPNPKPSLASGRHSRFQRQRPRRHPPPPHGRPLVLLPHERPPHHLRPRHRQPNPQPRLATRRHRRLRRRYPAPTPSSAAPTTAAGSYTP